MSKPLYIVIGGRKQTGKNTVASYLKELFESNGKAVTITSFAEPLKRFCNDIFGIPLEDMETEIGKKKTTHLKWEDLNWYCLNEDGYVNKTGPMTVREILQYFGSNICRNRFYYNIWAEAPFKKEFWTEKYSHKKGNIQHYPADVVIIADCRFKNELKIAQDNKAILFKIIRNTGFKDDHISEKDLDDVDDSNWGYIIDNNRTLFSLKCKINEIYKGIRLED